MSNSQTKCVIVLSSKSSGSSALQGLLVKHPQVHHVTRTRHYENETLYWTKAASILDRPQINMLDSEVPLSKEKAKRDLITLLSNNLENYSIPADDERLVFDGWRTLCQSYGPVFLEKSPHHLHQSAAIELILEASRRLPEIEFLLVGLVRNPMDVLYSMWRRWRNIPEQHQYEWFTAYNNLLKLKEVSGDNLVIVRYEDIVTDDSYLKEVYEFIGAPAKPEEKRYLHSKSIAKWKRDKFYGFTLAEEVVALAEQFGYERSDLINDSNSFWASYKHVSRSVHLNLTRPSIEVIARSRSYLKRVF